MPDELDELVAALDLGSARGGRRVAAPVEVEIVRSLGEDDLPGLTAPAPAASPGQRLLAIRHSHHQLAQLLAKGVEQAAASEITGYSPAYISSLKGDPAFRELLQHYGAEREAVFVDVIERMKVLGLSFQDELQQRLEADPAQFSRREIMEAIELLLLKPQAQRSDVRSNAVAPAVSVNVKFVTAQPAEPQPPSRSLDAVDLVFEDLPPVGLP